MIYELCKNKQCKLISRFMVNGVAGAIRSWERCIINPRRANSGSENLIGW